MSVARNSHASGGPRDYAIDLLRAGCILYIVGYWHLFGYTPRLFHYANIYTEALKDIALGTFVLVSGLLLARRPLALTAGEVRRFYARRVVRIYPLYLLALLLFLLTGFATPREVVEAALLVSMLTPPPIHTLWFMTMIIFFYVLAPLLIHAADDARKLIALGCALMLLVLLWSALVHPVDLRMLQYFPAFVLGVLYQRSKGFRDGVVRLRWLLLACLAPALVVGLKLGSSPEMGVLMRVPLVAAGALALYAYAARHFGRMQSRVIGLLSYASFGIYLFHRPVLEIALRLYRPAQPGQEALYLLAVGLPVTIAIAYLLQRSYDRWARAISARP